MQAVGRLDQDTTGLLLLSDDGAFVHAFTSPKRKVPKVYLATVRHALDDEQLAKLRGGVLLHGETKPSAALGAERRDERLVELTVLEGKYHQMKRMVAASGNRVEKLHRARVGGYGLPDSLAEGAWRPTRRRNFAEQPPSPDALLPWFAETLHAHDDLVEPESYPHYGDGEIVDAISAAQRAGSPRSRR